MNTQHAIEIESLSKRFASITALDHIDLTVRTGEVFGLLGPNGAGKTTLIDLLLGLTTPTDGRASVFGTDVESDPASIRQRIGILPEDYSIYRTMTGREQLQAIARLKNGSDDLDRVRNEVGLAIEAFDRPAGEYSKGMQQRLVLAMALLGDPELLILDEPLSGLDPHGIDLVRTLIEDHAASGTTIFFASHRLSEVAAICDRVGILNDGQLVSVVDVETLSERMGTVEQLRLFTETQADSSVLSQLRSIDAISSVHTDGCILTIDCHSSIAKADAIALIHQECSVLDFEVNSSALEDVFAAVVDVDGSKSTAESTAVRGDVE